MEPIAVVGLAGRLPGAPTIEAFWRNQRDGVESVSRFSTQQLTEAGWPKEMVEHRDYVPAAAVIEDADHFDAEFFGYTEEQARISDPQQRIFAECVWHALEDTGHDPSRFDGAVGVYAGCFANKYLPLNLLANARFRGSLSAFSARPYNDKDFLATRAAYLCDLRGPAMTVQSACSTSLVAIHLACQALLSRECDMALAGGVALPVPLIGGYPVVAGGIFARDGHCRPFDAASSGTVPGYGVTVVALRRLSDALADNDHIRALVLGSAVNNDGSAKFGFNAPSMQAQAEVIATAQAVAGVEPESIGYIEAHGTGTPLGDPIELAGLTKAFNTTERGFCAIGSTKANIGHLDAAAGAAGFARAVLALEHGEIPPSINFDAPNPALLLDRTPFYVPTTARPWPRGATPRRAGVSAFAVGGTNAHLVLQEAPAPRAAEPHARDRQLLVLSARNGKALADAARNLADRLDRQDDLDLADVAHTLQVGRREFPLRRHLVCRDRAEATAALRALAQPGTVDTADDVKARQVVFMFPGSASHRPDAATAVYRSEPVFAQEVDRCAELARPLLGHDLRALLFPSIWDGPQTGHDDPRGVPTAAFSLQWALARLWQSWGVHPAAMIGEGDGEYVAACLAGVIGLADAIDITAAGAEARSRAGTGGVPDASEFAAAVARHELKPPQVPYISAVTGTWITPQDAGEPAHWARHLREPAPFAEGLRELAGEDGRILLEVGPDSTLTETVARQGTAKRLTALASLTPARGSRSGLAALLDTVGKLWQATVAIDWDAFRGTSRPRRVSLPGYPFQRSRYWIGPDTGSYEPLGLEEASWTSHSLP
ncbi:type I polyketide synthase [Streptomyces actinomycinicus]|uniref:Type I polyketide synthase n=1 Tax=Streptomyces actinomycinicus TaxID=1695166 RepID=A0A937JLG5_9ACTN|nr:type I polyketide synthase [Streptomyces actinomycinicus]MBL1083589.1 type I polyketide synthase [Streptomyces actinomycinicus]